MERGRSGKAHSDRGLEKVADNPTQQGRETGVGRIVGAEAPSPVRGPLSTELGIQNIVTDQIIRNFMTDTVEP